MKPQRLVCIRCGRKSAVTLHGNSYCRRCAKVAVNTQTVSTLSTSPLHEQRNDFSVPTVHARPRTWHRWQDIHRWGGRKGKSVEARTRRVRRNRRRRALRKARSRSRT